MRNIMDGRDDGLGGKCLRGMGVEPPPPGFPITQMGTRPIDHGDDGTELDHGANLVGCARKMTNGRLDRRESSIYKLRLAKQVFNLEETLFSPAKQWLILRTKLFDRGTNLLTPGNN